MHARVALRKTSLVDFPARVASVLFFPGCNFRCPYCHNAELVLRGAEAEGLVDLDEAFAHLERRRGLVTGLVLSGGEALLHEACTSVADRARRLGFAVKLDTNGSFPERIESVGADYVALDLKTGFSRYARVAPSVSGAGDRVAESLEVLRRRYIPFEIRITCAPGVFDKTDAQELGPFLSPSDRVYLQRFRPGGCLDPSYDARDPYSEVELAELLALIRKAAPRAELRG